MMYVVFMKNFHHANSNEVTAVRLISASWAQKRLIAASRYGVRRVHKNFSSRRLKQAKGD